VPWDDRFEKCVVRVERTVGVRAFVERRMISVEGEEGVSRKRREQTSVNCG
jgi:hypothetical protein